MNEFKAFVLRGNVLGLAISVIIGGVFGKIVSSFVSDVLMPPIGMLLGNVDFSNLFVVLNGQSYLSLAEAKKAGAPTLNYGLFINAMMDFLILAFCVFMRMRAVNRRMKTEAAPVPAPTARDCPMYLMAVPLAAKKCGYCTSAL